jgi:(1->4)-alpha-D-glucan 1-alpha-D-glucosylmutase
LVLLIMPLPESTYRLQFHAGFTFRDAAAIVPYLHDLGITHLYASPYLKARPGSMHGYDVIDPCSLNPELGTEAEYEAWVDAMRSRGMSHILDIVPNHVGVGTNDNVWWNDVLEHGPASRYAHYFDIAWNGSPRPQLHDKVLLPLLGGPYGEVLEKGELKLTFENGAFAVHYYDRRFPISPRSYGTILGHNAAAIARSAERHDPAIQEYRAILRMADDLLGPDDPGVNLPGGAAEPAEVKRRLAALTADSPAVRQLIDENLADFNGTAGKPRSFDLLDDLLNDQSYRLSYWRVAPDEINYRRFFDINDLAALSMERAEVFEDAHRLVLKLVAEGKVDGLRVDHPDGLYNPKQYFERLQTAAAQESEWHGFLARAGDAAVQGSLTTQNRSHGLETRATPHESTPRLYVVAEKILAPDEFLPDDWPVHGTTGYDFLNKVNGLFIDPASEQSLTDVYASIAGYLLPYDYLVWQNKRLILDVALASELQMLAHRLDRFAQRHRWSRDYTLAGLREALGEVIAWFPVYRSYVDRDGVRETDRAHVERAARLASQKNHRTGSAIFHFIRDVLLQRYAEAAGDVDRVEQLEFAARFQQLTAPVTAKGVEDTVFYVFNRFVSLNEVGGDPDHFGEPPDKLHEYFAARQARWPYSLSALSTHDTKRSEDVRARLNVLSEMPDEWARAVMRWNKQNEAYAFKGGISRVASDRNIEYLIYQTLVGAWPLDPYSPEEYATFVRRIQAYMEKAMREAKEGTTWTSPNVEFEGAVKQFIAHILDESVSREFLDDFRQLQRTVAHHGLLNSLAQTVLKLAAPGVPDTYQGTELWDFSLVDPDNRRPVNYERRRRMLGDVSGTRRVSPQLARELFEKKQDGQIKLFVTSQALRARRDNPGLFSEGEYLAAEVTGRRRDHVFAFARRHGGRAAVVAVPRLVTGDASWDDTRLVFKQGEVDPRARYANLFTGETLLATRNADGTSFPVSALFATLPFAVLLRDD